MNQYEYLVTVVNNKQEPIDSFFHVTEDGEDTMFEGLIETVDRSKYKLEILYLGIKHKPRKLKKLAL